MEDINDNQPKFEKTEYTLELKEHSEKGTIALKSNYKFEPTEWKRSEYIYARDDDLESDRKREMGRCETGTGFGDVVYQIEPASQWFEGEYILHLPWDYSEYN